MKKKLEILSILLYITALLLCSSCADTDLFQDSTEYSTTFRVYECNEEFLEQNSASSRFVSEGAVITIWKLNNKNGYDVVRYLRVGIDGVAVYHHNDEIIFYSVEKDLPHTDKGDQPEAKKNLTTLHLRDEKGKVVNTVQFQIEGVFTSQDDIDAHAKFNFGVAETEYKPQIGALKFKDINNDGYIDIEDSISRAMVDTWNGNNEEIVYINQ